MFPWQIGKSDFLASFASHALLGREGALLLNDIFVLYFSKPELTFVASFLSAENELQCPKLLKKKRRWPEITNSRQQNTSCPGQGCHLWAQFRFINCPLFNEGLELWEIAWNRIWICSATILLFVDVIVTCISHTCEISYMVCSSQRRPWKLCSLTILMWFF